MSAPFPLPYAEPAYAAAERAIALIVDHGIGPSSLIAAADMHRATQAASLTRDCSARIDT
jgi:hypothetical protein